MFAFIALLFSHILVIIMTILSGQGNELQGLGQGANDSIPKLGVPQLIATGDLRIIPIHFRVFPISSITRPFYLTEALK